MTINAEHIELFKNDLLNDRELFETIGAVNVHAEILKQLKRYDIPGLPELKTELGYNIIPELKRFLGAAKRHKSFEVATFIQDKIIMIYENTPEKLYIYNTDIDEDVDNIDTINKNQINNYINKLLDKLESLH